MLNKTPKNEHNGLENEKSSSKKIYAIFIVIGGVLLALVLSLSLISFGGDDSKDGKNENEANRLFSLLKNDESSDKEVFSGLESNPDSEFEESNAMDTDTQKLLDSVGRNSNQNNGGNSGECLDCQTQKKLQKQLKQCIEQCGDDANCRLKCIETYQQVLDDYARKNKFDLATNNQAYNSSKEKALAKLKEALKNCLATCNGDKACEAKCVEEYEKAP